jgi:hypothetical protein
MAVHCGADGRRIITYSGLPLSRHRSLVQASDFEAALQDPAQFQIQAISHKQPRVLIETMKIIGPDRLTACDAALYELLLVNAKHHGIDRSQHSLSLSSLMLFAGIRHIDRVKASLTRIAHTRVRYDVDDLVFRDGGSVPLISIDNIEDLVCGSSVLIYSLPDVVKHTILTSFRYAKVDLAPMPRFSGKYSGRLYQHLCIRAGYDDGFSRDWTISVADLMRALGYRDVARTSRFVSQVVEPALAEIDEHVDRFTVTMDKRRRASGRALTFKDLTFRITRRTKSQAEMMRAGISQAERNRITAPDRLHRPEQLPSLRAVTVAAQTSGRAAVELSEGWRALLDRAKNDRGEVLWHDRSGPMSGERLLEEIAYGVDGAFTRWADRLPTNKPIPTSRLHQIVERRPFVGAAFQTVSSDPVKAAFERRWMTVMNAAAEAQEMLDGLQPGTTARRDYGDDEITSWLNPRGQLFAGLEPELSTRFDIVRLGLAGAASLSGDDLRQTLGDFIKAIRRSDLTAVVDLCERLVKVRYRDRRPRAERLRSAPAI